MGEDHFFATRKDNYTSVNKSKTANLIRLLQTLENLFQPSIT